MLGLGPTAFHVGSGSHSHPLWVWDLWPFTLGLGPSAIHNRSGTCGCLCWVWVLMAIHSRSGVPQLSTLGLGTHGYLFWIWVLWPSTLALGPTAIRAGSGVLWSSTLDLGLYDHPHWVWVSTAIIAGSGVPQASSLGWVPRLSTLGLGSWCCHRLP